MADLNRHGVKGHPGINDLWFKGHPGINDLWFKFLQKGVTVSIYFDVFSWDLDVMIPA